MSEFQKDELSLEETNKLRISLGLKPLEPDSDDEGEKAQPSKRSQDDGDDDDPLKNQDEKAARNYAEHQEASRKRSEEQRVKDRIAKAQNRRELNRKLQGRTLGEAEPAEQATSVAADVDAKQWLKKQRKKAQEHAARRLEEEAEAEAAAGRERATYDSNDLRGIRVGHKFDEFDLEDEGEERILTLRDSKILENDEDELMDAALDEAERDRRNEERKKGPKKYTGLDDEEFGIGQAGKKRGILSKYDDTIENNGGQERDEDAGFRLGGETRSMKERSEEARRDADRLLNRSLLDLDYAKNEEISDYLTEAEVGFKKKSKSKKKKRAPATRIRLDDDEENNVAPSKVGEDEDVAMADAPSDSASRVAQRVKDMNADLIDDDDLAKSLANARRKQARKTFQKMTPEMIAQNLAAQRAAEEEEEKAAAASRGATSAEDGSNSAHDVSRSLDNVKQEGNDDEDALIFDETTEFVRNVQAARVAQSDELTQRLNTNGHSLHRASSAEQISAATTMVKKEEDSGIDATSLLQPAVTDAMQQDTDEEEQEDEKLLGNGEGEVKSEEEEDNESSGLGRGLGAALSILRNQGLITQITPEQRARELEQQKYDLWLSERRTEDQLRGAELAQSKAQGSAKDQAQREHENRMRELEDARSAQDRFKDYKPDIEIKYHDEFGRVLDHHQAWKRLSHVFHGKAPGRKKQEQRLQRIEEEKRSEKMLAGDTPTGMTKAFSERAERSGQAHMVLGVGSRNNAPQDATFLGSNMLRNGASKGKARSDQQQAAANEGDVAPAIGGDAPSRLTSDFANGITSMVPRSTVTRNKAAFAPIKRADSVASSMSAQHPIHAAGSNGAETGAASPAATSKFKLAFGVKRSAQGSPSTESPPVAKHGRLEAE